jgi:hypothetical protein
VIVQNGDMQPTSHRIGCQKQVSKAPAVALQRYAPSLNVLLLSLALSYLLVWDSNGTLGIRGDATIDEVVLLSK